MPAHTSVSRSQGASARPSFSDRPVAPARPGAPSGGQALDRHTQSEMSARFGHDFSSVRIHTDAQAARSAASLGANAYALGDAVIFGEGRYTPGSPDTERLLAHELTHVVQQARFGAGDASRRSRSGDASEREAGDLAAQVLAGRSVDVRAVPDAAVARDPHPLVCSEDQPDPSPAPAPPVPAMDGGVPSVDAPAPAPAASTPATAAASTPATSPWVSTADNPITNSTPYQAATNNALSGGVAVTDAAAEGINTMPNFARAATRAGGYRGMSAVFGAEDALAAPAAASRLLRPAQSLGGMSRVSAALAPVGLASNAISMQDDIAHGHFADATADAAGVASSAIATTALAGAGMTAAGGTSLAGALGVGTTLAEGGAALSGAVATGTALGTAGAVLGAGAAGYATGRLLDQGANWAGQHITGDHTGDYSISNGLSHVMGGADDLATRGMRAVGAYDDHRPAYTQTMGYRLGSLFTPTVRADGTQDSFTDRLRENF